VQFCFLLVIAGGRDSDENVVLPGFQFPFKRAHSYLTTLVVVFLPIDGAIPRIATAWRHFESYPKGSANQNALQSQ
jgi:hypothetical protein